MVAYTIGRYKYFLVFLTQMNLSERNRKVAISRWKKIHSQVRINSDFSKNKTAINAYLCGDGNIGVSMKKFNYYIRFFIDDLILAKRIVNLFEIEFNIKPAIRVMKSKVLSGEGYYKIEISNKPVCNHLLELGRYGHLLWAIPLELKESFKDEWIRYFFDCEAYVNLKKRQIQLKSVNGHGMVKLKGMLEKYHIFPKLYGPYDNGPNHNPYYFLIILGKENITKYHDKIGFYHSRKIKSLVRLVQLLHL